ncbi:MAG: transglutaminase TgpA family protein [Granulosicoccaceae bacterium]
MLSQRNALAEQISLGGLIWLLAAQLTVILPYTGTMHLWILPALVFSVTWRALAMLGRVSRPSTYVKLALVVVAFGSFALSGGVGLDIQSMVSLLLLSFAFKSIETDSRRDAIVVIWVAFFLIATRFLFEQTIPAAIYGVVSMVCVTTTLIAVQNPNSALTSLSRLRLGGGMLLACAPLMLVIFVVAPRLPPLWSMPELSSGSQTGVSDSMTPGDIANLSQSDSLAFRAAFKGPRPPQSQLYWRGMVMSDFDGKTWRPFSKQLEDEELRRLFSEELPQRGFKTTSNSRTLDYELLMETSNQPWLFTLSPVVETQPKALLGFDYRAIAPDRITSPRIYQVKSQLGVIRDQTLDPWVRELSLQLPDTGNERSRVLAQEMRVQAPSAESYVEAVMSRYTEQPFHYTLKPPTLGDLDTIDNFLFESQRGFCAHYAGSFVFLMRAAGIPARVVAGYQGGEWNEEEQYFAVRQYDAHAWTEVWLQGRGWVRFDPTARVAPDRVEQNLREALKEEGSFLSGSPFAMSRYNWMGDIRRSWDAAQYRWRKFVINYDGDSQLELLTSLLGKLNSTRIGIAALLVLLGIGLIWGFALGLFKRGRKIPAHQKLYEQFQRLMAKNELPREVGMTPSEHAELAAHAWPNLAENFKSFVQDYNTACYRDETASEAQLKRMRARLKSLNRADWKASA